MNKISHYLKFKNLSKNWEKNVFLWKNGILNPLEILRILQNFMKYYITGGYAAQSKKFEKSLEEFNDSSGSILQGLCRY